jgi:hypothetical protein
MKKTITKQGDIKMAKPKSNRIVTNEDVKKYIPMVNKYLRDSVIKNWNEANMSTIDDEVSLGNTGMAMTDMRQQLYMELVVALKNYNPEYLTAEGKSVKESTFVFAHLFNRTGQLMKKLTKKRYGYGMWASNLEEAIGDRFEDE